MVLWSWAVQEALEFPISPVESPQGSKHHSTWKSKSLHLRCCCNSMKKPKLKGWGEELERWRRVFCFFSQRLRTFSKICFTAPSASKSGPHFTEGTWSGLESGEWLLSLAHQPISSDPSFKWIYSRSFVPRWPALLGLISQRQGKSMPYKYHRSIAAEN